MQFNDYNRHITKITQQVLLIKSDAHLKKIQIRYSCILLLLGRKVTELTLM